MFVTEENDLLTSLKEEGRMTETLTNFTGLFVKLTLPRN